MDSSGTPLKTIQKEIDEIKKYFKLKLGFSPPSLSRLSECRS